MKSIMLEGDCIRWRTIGYVIDGIIIDETDIIF